MSLERIKLGCAAAIRTPLLAMAILGAGITLSVDSKANDSTARLDAGGLRLTFNPHIQLVQEDLYLSRDAVRVFYRFHNTSDRDIETLVAFPLPEMEIGEDIMYAFSGKDPVNVMDFQVVVDGTRITPSVEVKATRFGVDITEVLRRYNIPVTMHDVDGADAVYKRLNGLPAEAKRELERAGAIDWSTTFDPNNRPIANVHWQARIAFYWFQRFPAQRTIEVRHSYRPVPSSFFFGEIDLTSAEMRDGFCMDGGFMRSARERMRKSSINALAAHELQYVLTTGGNWLGPIQKFRLTVEKPSPGSLVSLCAPGIQRTNATTFSLSRDNFVPDADLRILFLDAPQ